MKELKDIKAPLLTSATYGSDVNKIMSNIDENFKILGNRDFIKGDKGNSIRTQTIDLSQNIFLLNELKLAVKKQYSTLTTQPKNINGYSIMDWFKNPGSITLIYETVDGEDTIISSLPYVFKDMRFEDLAKVIDKKSNYDNETDYSCVIYYDQGEFVTVQEFPTLYYDNTLGDFSWKINGVETGLVAMGPAGPAGRDGVFKVVRVNKNAISPNVYMISHILYGSTWIDATVGAIETEDGLILDGHSEICKYYGIEAGTPVMALKSEYDNSINSKNLTYISEAFEDEGKDISEKRMVLRLTAENEICEVEPLTNSEIDSLCDKYLGKYKVETETETETE